MRRRLSALFTLAPFAAGLFACGDTPPALGPEADAPSVKHDVLPAVPLVAVEAGGTTARILPYLTDDLATSQDPVNLVLSGAADPRAVRNALLGLDGARGAPFPPVFPFTCTWTDAVGGLMAGYAESSGWGGAAIQLQCGRYGPIRFHLRLVKAGALTIANGHFEVLIPGTTDHQVLSWELAEQLITYDLARSGLLVAAPALTPVITGAPAHRAIPPVIYNGLPVELRVLVGGPAGDVSSGVGIGNDGRATILVLAAGAPDIQPEARTHEVLQFNQVIPKPFCAGGPGEYLLIQGPVTLDHDVSTGSDGGLRMGMRAQGSLTALPIDPGTGLPAGPAFRAEVSERQESRADDPGGRVSGMQHQQLLPSGLPGAGALVIKLTVSPGKDPAYDRTVSCK